jgi:hypothetical protein
MEGIDTDGNNGGATEEVSILINASLLKTFFR